MNNFLDIAFELLLSNGVTQIIGAVLWGVASVLLSPCGIAIVPLVVGYIADTDSDTGVTRWDAFKISCAFCAGIIVNLSLVAFVTSGFGMLLGGHERFLTLITASVFIIMGLHMTGLVHLSWLNQLFSRLKRLTVTKHKRANRAERERHGLRGALALGIISGLAVGPCSIAYISPVLSIAMSLATSGPAMAVGLILAYAVGYCAVLVLAGTFAQIASVWLQGNDRALRVLNIICGIALIAGGIYFIKQFTML